MKFPKPIMRTSELIKMGFPEEFLALETLWWMPHFMVCSIHFELLVKSCQMEFRNHEFYSLPRVWLC